MRRDVLPLAGMIDAAEQAQHLVDGGAAVRRAVSVYAGPDRAGNPMGAVS